MKFRHVWINRSTLKKIFFVLTGLVVAYAIYAPALTGEFQFDDYPFIVKNYLIRDISRLDLILQCLNQPSRFVVFYTFALNYRWSGLDAFGFHVTNWLIHVLTTFIVYQLSLTLLSSKKIKPVLCHKDYLWMSLSAALLFFVHPVQTQAVSYVSQRFTLLATFFYLLTVLSYVKARQTSRLNFTKVCFFVAAFLTAFLGMFSKEIVITLPIILCVVDVYFIESRSGIKGAKLLRKGHLFYAVIFILFLSIIPALFSFKFIGVLFGPKNSGSHEGEIITLGPYVMTQLRVYTRFLQLLFWPGNQTFDYDFPLSRHLFEQHTLGCLILLSLIFIAGAWLRKSRTVFSFGIMWFYITLLPNLIPRSHVIFEHKLYLVSYGIILLAVVGLFDIIRNQRVRHAILSFVIAFFCLLTFQRNLVWHDQVSFWQDAVIKAPNKSRPYMNLGSALVKAGKLDEALYFLDKALEINPDLWEVWSNKGLIYTEQKKYGDAKVHFAHSMELKPDYEETYNNRGSMFFKKGEYNLALRDYFKSIKINPAFEQPYYNIGRVYYARSDYETARQYYEKALELFPDFYKAYNGIGLVYTQQGKYERAERSFFQALELKDNVAEVYNNLGYLCYQKRQYERALVYFNRAIELNPLFFKAYNNRANVYQLQKKFEQALQDYEKTLVLDPEYAEAYSNRGVTYRVQGQLKQALQDLDRAVLLARDVAEFHNNRANILKDLKDWPAAIDAYSKAIELKPHYNQALINRALLYKRTQSYQNALADLKKVIALDPRNITAYINRGNIFSLTGQYDLALDNYARAIVIDPDLKAAYYNRALTYTKLKEYSKALEDRNALIRLQPLSARSYYQRAKVYVHLKQKEKALSDANRAKELGADIPEEFFEQLNNISSIK